MGQNGMKNDKNKICTYKTRATRRISDCPCLSMGYKKDIFAVFAYEFELLQKMKSLLTQEWNQLTLMKSSALPQMKLNPPIRRRGGFHPTKLDFIVEDDFTHPKGGFSWKKHRQMADCHKDILNIQWKQPIDECEESHSIEFTWVLYCGFFVF